ncbi:MAG: cobalamin-dependent protein [Myxococcota bacterium]|nr:cobalamin-dependent protein [Myxococcota bacterium]
MRNVVSLVGRRLSDNENLGLGYLGAALEVAGIESQSHVLNAGGDVPRVARQIAQSDPMLVGISVPDGGSAFLPMALVALLRQLGYHGHITAGGPFATSARAFLLDRCEGLDSVVRFAGEGPIVELFRALSHGRDVREVPGLSTRDGDGQPAKVLDDRWRSLVPLRTELPSLAGHAACHISMTRGCEGRCSYCGPASLQRLEMGEGQAAGLDRGALRCAGVGGVRRRDIDSVCDEMAQLHGERDVRYFYFVDEHLLPYGESEALEFLEVWGEGLRRRGVGPMGIGCMLRADRLTKAMVRAFAKIGLVRAFIGIELAGAPEDRGYGRPMPRPQDLELLEVFESCKVATVSNLMLVHPESSPRSIRAGLALLSSIPAGVFEATRMMPYHGTALTQRLADESRLLGNPLRYSYTYRSQAAQKFAELFLKLRGQAFFDYSLAYRTHDVFLAVALHERVNGRSIRPTDRQRLERLRRNLNALQVRSFRQALELALDGCDCGQEQQLVDTARAGASALRDELADIEKRMGEQLGQPLGLLTPLRHVAASAVGFCLAGAVGLGCHAEGDISTDTGTADTGTVDDTESATETELECQNEASMKARLAKDLPCFTGYVNVDESLTPTAHLSIWTGEGYPFTWSECSDSTAGAALSQQATALLGEPETCEPNMGFNVDGGIETDLAAMRSAASSCGESIGNVEFPPPDYAIILDHEGKVTGVEAQGESTQAKEAAQCLANVLVGLTFPCLSDFRICPEYIIAE